MHDNWPFKTVNRDLIAQIYDNYHEGLFILDRQGLIVYYNRLMAQMDGYITHDQMAGKHFIEIYNLNEKTSVSLGALAQQKPMKNRAIFYHTRLGTLVNAYCNSYPFFEDGQLAGAFCFTTDYSVASTALEELTRNYAARSPAAENSLSPAAMDAPHSFAHLVGKSPAFMEAVEKAKVAAEHNMPIMLVGETGSGKELFAQSIHNHKSGRQRRFMAVNCPAIPENLLESLLFGTTKGSFTGAMDKAGIFEAADGGTIFLDEINSMPLDLQSKLLRVLQEKKVSRVGSTKETRVDCRVISATSHNPYSEMAAQRLRQDLFYRLGAVLVHIPPLRERAEDIGLLCEHFIKKHRVNLKSRVRGVTPETLAWLERKVWPGNVRELEHAVASAILFAKDEAYLKIENFATLDHFLEPASRPKPEANFPAPLEPAEDLAAWDLPPSHRQAKERQEALEKERLGQALERTGGHKAAAAAILGISPQLLHSKLKKYGLNPVAPSDEQEKEKIIQALNRTGGHKSAAAAILGISRQLLYSKLKKHGLD